MYPHYFNILLRNFPEKCRFPGLLSYPYTGVNNCRAHWACNEGRSEARCCPQGYAYRPYYGCTPDPKCNDRCPPQFFNDVTGPCNTRPNAESLLHYEQLVNGHGWMKRPCAPGTQYDPVSCVCAFHTGYIPGKGMLYTRKPCVIML